MDSNQTGLRWYIVLIIVTPILVYLGLVKTFAYNFPFLDDYGTILAHSLKSSSEQIENWFIPHNEHVHLVLKSTASFDLWLFGTINLTRLIWLGAVIFLIFFWKLMKAQVTEGLPWFWLVPLPFLLFQPSYWGTITWSTTSLHNFPGLLFAFMALQLWASKNLYQKLCALGFVCLALLTNGFGMAVLATLILWATLELWHSRKSFTQIQIIPAIGLLSITLAWIAFRISLGELNLQANIDGNTAIEYAHYLTNFLGSCFHFLGSPSLNLIAILILGLFAFLCRQGLVKKHPVLFYFIVYLLLSAIMTTVARTDLGPKQGLASRYRIYSTLLLCTTYLGFAHLYWKSWDGIPRLRFTLIGAAVTFYSASLFVNIPNLNKIKVRLEADEQRWRQNEPIQEFIHAEHAALILDECSKHRTFLPKEHR